MTPDEAQELAVKHLEVTKVMYEAMGYNNMNPTVHLRKEGETDIAVVLVGATTGYLFEAIQAGIKTLPWEPDSIVVMMDAFHEKIDKDDVKRVAEIESGRHEPLAARFARGDSGVTEAISAAVMSADCHVMARQPYKYTPVDSWEWGEVEVLDMTEEGRMTDWDWNALIKSQPRQTLASMRREE